MMDKIEFNICIHSVIDIITNSSTEMFVSATIATETSVKNLFKCILGMNNIIYNHIDDVIEVKPYYYRVASNYDDIIKECPDDYATEESKEALMENLSDESPAYYIKIQVKPLYEIYFSDDMIKSIEQIVSSMSTEECLT